MSQIRFEGSIHVRGINFHDISFAIGYYLLNYSIFCYQYDEI